MRISDFSFEGPFIKDADDLSFSFEVLTNDVFPDGLLEAHFSGEEISEPEKTPEFKKLVEGVLDEDTLNMRLFGEINFIPFISAPEYPALTAK
jgi:hypothetical protein